MYYLMDSKRGNQHEQRTAAVVTNLHNGLSSMVFVIVSLVSETYTGCFTAITFCAAASIQVTYIYLYIYIYMTPSPLIGLNLKLKSHVFLLFIYKI